LFVFIYVFLSFEKIHNRNRKKRKREEDEETKAVVLKHPDPAPPLNKLSINFLIDLFCIKWFDLNNHMIAYARAKLWSRQKKKRKRKKQKILHKKIKEIKEQVLPIETSQDSKGLLRKKYRPWVVALSYSPGAQMGSLRGFFPLIFFLLFFFFLNFIMF
jgi:hypothetical protein